MLSHITLVSHREAADTHLNTHISIFILRIELNTHSIFEFKVQNRELNVCNEFYVVVVYMVYLAFKDNKDSLWWQNYDSLNLKVQLMYFFIERQILSLNKGKPVVPHFS